MPLNITKCETCDGNIIYDHKKQTGYCDSCGRTYIYEKPQEIHNKNIIKVENAKFGESLEERLKAAETYLIKHCDYDKAEEFYHLIAEKNPDAWQAWWGQVRALSYEFTRLELEENEDGESQILSDLVDNMNKTLNVIDDEEVFSEIRDKWNMYIQAVFEEYENGYERQNAEKERLENIIAEHEKSYAEMDNISKNKSAILVRQENMCNNLQKEINILKTKVLSKTELISGWTIFAGIFVLWIFYLVRAISTREAVYMGMAILYLLMWISDCIVWGIFFIVYLVKKSKLKKKEAEQLRERQKLPELLQIALKAAESSSKGISDLKKEHTERNEILKRMNLNRKFIINYDIDDLLIE